MKRVEETASKATKMKITKARNRAQQEPQKGHVNIGLVRHLDENEEISSLAFKSEGF